MSHKDYDILVPNGFWPFYALCAARTCLFRLINMQNGALRPLPNAHCSFAVLLLINDRQQSAKFCQPLWESSYERPRHKRVFYHWITEAERQWLPEAVYGGKILVVAGKSWEKSFCKKTTRRQSSTVDLYIINDYTIAMHLCYFRRFKLCLWREDRKEILLTR
jgi:hypothetical protein